MIIASISHGAHDEAVMEKDDPAGKCASLKKERSAASDANDWAGLERLSKLYISCCNILSSTEDIAIAYSDIARANNGLKQYKKALEASDKGITENYFEPGCHIQRGIALMGMERKQDAKMELITAEKLTVKARQLNLINLTNKNTTKAQHEFYNANADYLESFVFLINALKFELGIDD